VDTASTPCVIAKLNGTSEREPSGSHVVVRWKMRVWLRKLWEVINFYQRLGFKYGYSLWKDLIEKNPIMGFV
jgi:hypothetical protein